MTQTPTQIRDRAGSDLGLLRLGQSLQSQDATRITQAYAEVYARLVKEGIAVWASTGNVPDEVAPYVIALVCANCLSTYGVSKDRYERIIQTCGPDGLLVMQRIRELMKAKFVSQDEAKDY